MTADSEQWSPGSFTKNFSWGDESSGLLQLHESIRLGFAGAMSDVPRAEFRARVEGSYRPDYIPMNFFLFNRVVDGIDHLIADELVFQALNEVHSPRFDKLALFAFNFSFAGKWRGAKPYQRRPALWSNEYVKKRVDRQFHWNTKLINAGDIEGFVFSDPRYTGKTVRKLATNLNYLYRLGRLSEFAETRVERWWVDALFLALDRLIEDRKLDGKTPIESRYGALLSRSDFQAISGNRSVEKDLATKHLITLYTACGARERFSDELVKERTALKLPEVEWLFANDYRPQGAVHPTNPQILKNIPRACAMLARYAGFDVIDADELANFNAAEFIRRHTRDALANLRERRIKPTMSAEELTRITRER
ncbi:MAG TPA: hypothetical protein VII49_06860 [Rhizomicrobium sp.]